MKRKMGRRTYSGRQKNKVNRKKRMNTLRGITQPFMGVNLSKKEEKKNEKKRTIKAGDISFVRRQTLLPEI
jgi:hypothetical protein